MPPGTDMVCYADATLVLAGGRGWYETQRLAETAVACAVRAMRRLGLNVSPTKSEALGFSDRRTRGAPPPELCVYIDGEEVPVRSPGIWVSPLTADGRSVHISTYWSRK
jgi:hypothetical protein